MIMCIKTSTFLRRRPIRLAARHSVPPATSFAIQGRAPASLPTAIFCQPRPSGYSDCEETEMRRLVASLAVCLGAASPSFAENPTSGFVRLHAIDLLERALTQEQQTKLQLVAYQTAIADVCLGFTLDDAKMGK